MRRWIKRIALMLAMIVVTSLGFVVIAIHTDWGREIARRQVDKVLADTFTGGGHVGKIEGSVFGELVLRDVVLDGPDGKPAFTIGALHVKLRLLPLLRHKAVIDELVAEDVTVLLARDVKGRLEIANLLVPGPKSKWHVELADVRIRRVTAMYDAGGELVHLDDASVDGTLMTSPDGPLDATATVTGTWRERATPVALTARTHIDQGVVELPYTVARVGGATASASSVTIDHGRYGGGISITAPARAIGELIPGVELPGDAIVSVRAVPGAHALQIAASALVGKAPVHALLIADLDANRVAGVVGAAGIDASVVTNGKLTGTGDAVAIVDIAPGAAGEMPVAHAIVQARGAISGLAEATLVARVATHGHTATAIGDVASAAGHAHIEGEIRRDGGALELVHGTVRGTARDLHGTSGGRIAATGAFDIDLAASGSLVPAPNVTVRGRIDGRNVAFAGASASRVHALIDARSLPAHPRGTAHVELDGVVRGDTQLGQLTIDAANRSDGKIAVQLRSTPKFAPLVIDADAVIAPGASTVIDLERHHVRAYGNDWNGTGGRLTIGGDTIEVRDVTSSAGAQKLAIAGTLHRSSGDFDASVKLEHFGLETFNTGYRGHADARIDVVRKRGIWNADAKVAIAALSLDPVLTADKLAPITTDANLELRLHDRAVVVSVSASGKAFGSAKAKLDLVGPARITDVRAWQHLGREAIHEASFDIRRVDLEAVARAYRLAPMRGHVDANLAIKPDGVTGKIVLDQVSVDALRTAGPISTDLTIEQTSHTELSPKGRIRLGNAGTIGVDAKLEIPDRLLDVASWRALGRDVLHSASIRTDAIALDQGLLARFGIDTEIHGELGVSVDVDRGGRTMRAAIDLRKARGGPIAKPVDIHVDAVTDGDTTTARLAIRRKNITIMSGAAELRVPIDSIRSTTPLVGTIEIPSVPAPELVSILGRTDITKGSVDGKIAIAGTVGHPTVKAKLAVKDIALQPTSRTKSIQTLNALDIDASWDGTTAKLAIDGKESAGGKLHIEAQAQPGKLAAATASIEASNLDLQPLAVFAPDPGSAIRGRLDGKLELHGFDSATAKLTGKLKITDARVPIAPTVGTLRRATIEIGIDEHQLDISIDGKLGGGTVTAKGKASLAKGDVSGAEIKMQLRKVSPIGSVEPRIDADVTTKISRAADRWKLDVVVDRGSVFVPTDRNERLAEVGEPADMRFIQDKQKGRATGHKPTRTQLEVDITLHDMNLESDELRGIIRGKLAISIGDGIGFVGDVEADRGDLDLFGQRYTVDHAAVHFDGSPDPLLDISVTHDFPDVTTRTQVQGRLSSPKLTMTSEPAIYSQGQLLGFLLGGEPNGDPQSGGARQTATDAGASVLGSRLTGYLRNTLPVSLDVLRYESATASTSAAVLVGTWLTRTLFLAYRQHLDALPDENTGEGTLEYWLSRRLVLEGTVGDRNVDGLDLLWRRRW